ncbi:MAG: lipopolysaccharide biosynthesis protein [Pseudomonadota bacterium]
MGGLGRPGVAAVKWSTVSTVARFVLQLGAQVVLARTLGPEIFGIFAIGMVVLTFANFVSSFGFSWSLMQRATLHPDDVRFAWTWQILVGLATMVAVYLAAPWLAGYFREPRAEPVIQWLSIACLLSAAAAPATYLLQRDLNFRAVGIVQVASYAAGYVCVGMPMALMGWGASSLVAAWLVQAAVQLVASYAYHPHEVKPLFWYADAKAAITTGRAVFLTNIVNWVLGNLDRIMIGRLLNAQALGLYNVAANLATMPNTLLLGALQPAFLAAGAKLQHDLPRLGRAYLQMVSTVVVLAVPAFVFMALVAQDLVHLLYGPKWSDAGWVLTALFLAMPVYVIWGLSTPVLWNTHRKNHEFALQLPLIAVGALAFYAFAGRGIHTAAAIAALLLVARALVIAIAAFRALCLPLASIAPQVGRGLMLSALCALGVWIGQSAVARFDSPLVSLMSAGLLSLIVAGVPVLLRPQWLGTDTVDMLLRFFPQLARFFRREPAAQLSESLP